MKKNSTLTIFNLRNIIRDLLPIKIYINKTLVWDENDKDLNSEELLDYILTSQNIVYSLKFDYVDFHHSIVYLEVKE